MGALAGKVIGNKLGQKGQEQEMPEQYADIANYFKKLQQENAVSPQAIQPSLPTGNQFSLLK